MNYEWWIYDCMIAWYITYTSISAIYKKYSHHSEKKTMEIFVENVFFIILVIIIVSKPVTRGKRNESISPLYEATGITCNLIWCVHIFNVRNSF